MRRIWILLATLLLAGVSSGASYAQMNNKPYDFGSGHIGMSKAGRQAIIDQKLNNVTPDNLGRDEFGNVTSVIPGPGGTPVVVDRAGVKTAGQGGNGQGRDTPPWRQGPGRFNSFFVKFDGLPYIPQDGSSSGATIDGWTGNVQGMTTIGGNSVDAWTSMVYYLAY